MLSDHTIRDCISLVRPLLHRYVIAELKAARARAIRPDHDAAIRSIDQSLMSLPENRPDTLALCRVVLDQWDLVFGRKWSAHERRMIQELRRTRNRHAHEDEFDEQEIDDFVDLCSELAATLGDKGVAEACQRLRRSDLSASGPSVPPPLGSAASPHPSFEGLQPVYRSSSPPYAWMPAPKPGANAVPAVALSGQTSRTTSAQSSLSSRAQGARLYARGEDLADFFESLGWRTVDKRSKGGCLWVIGDDAELAQVIADIALSHGIIFQSAPDGGRASNYEPAWFTTNPA